MKAKSNKCLQEYKRTGRLPLIKSTEKEFNCDRYCFNPEVAEYAYTELKNTWRDEMNPVLISPVTVSSFIRFSYYSDFISKKCDGRGLFYFDKATKSAPSLKLFNDSLSFFCNSDNDTVDLITFYPNGYCNNNDSRYNGKSKCDCLSCIHDCCHKPPYDFHFKNPAYPGFITGSKETIAQIGSAFYSGYSGQEGIYLQYRHIDDYKNTYISLISYNTNLEAAPVKSDGSRISINMYRKLDKHKDSNGANTYIMAQFYMLINFIITFGRKEPSLSGRSKVPAASKKEIIQTLASPRFIGKHADKEKIDAYLEALKDYLTGDGGYKWMKDIYDKLIGISDQFNKDIEVSRILEITHDVLINRNRRLSAQSSIA